MSVPPHRGSRVLTPGAPAPDTPTFLICQACGMFAMVPYAVFERGAEAHHKACIGPLIRRLADTVLPATERDPFPPPEVQS